jgi:ribonuclease HI
MTGLASAFQAAGLGPALLDTPARVGSTDGAWTLHVDGSSGNGRGASGAGALLVDPSGETVCACARYLGHSDSCSAEYAAIELGLGSALRYAPARLRVYGDAKVVIDCLRGSAEARRMRAAHDRVLDAARLFAAVEYVYVPREANACADALARQAVRSASVLYSELMRRAALTGDVERAALLLRDAQVSRAAISREGWLALIAASAADGGEASARHVADAAALALPSAGGATALLAASEAGDWRRSELDSDLARWGHDALAQLVSPGGVTITAPGWSPTGPAVESAVADSDAGAGAVLESRSDPWWSAVWPILRRLLASVSITT